MVSLVVARLASRVVIPLWALALGRGVPIYIYIYDMYDQNPDPIEMNSTHFIKPYTRDIRRHHARFSTHTVHVFRCGRDLLSLVAADALEVFDVRGEDRRTPELQACREKARVAASLRGRAATLPSLSSALGHRHKRPKPCAQPGAPHVLSQTAGTPEIAEVSQSSWLPATKMHRRSTFWNLTSLSSRRCARLSGDKARTWSQRALRVKRRGRPRQC